MLDVLRDVLLQHMGPEGMPDALPVYQVVRAVYVGSERSGGRLLTDEDIEEGRDYPTGLVLTMADGSELLLTLKSALA